MTGLTLPDDAEQSETYPFADADERYVVVRKPDEQGAVVAKFEKDRFPKDLYDIDSLICTYPGSKNALDNLDVDWTADLTDEEAGVLEKAGWPVR